MRWRARKPVWWQIIGAYMVCRFCIEFIYSGDVLAVRYALTLGAGESQGSTLGQEELHGVVTSHLHLLAV